MGSVYIGLFGGSFDPIHLGHLIAAQIALEEAGLDQVWFVPTFLSPHKEGQRATAMQRLKMVQLAIEGNPDFGVNTLEIERGSVSYTIDTVKAMAERYPQHRFDWIVGADMAIDFPNWQNADEILQYVGLLALSRPGHHLERWVAELPPDSPLFGKIRIIPMLQLDISSSDIRRRVKSGLKITYLTPPKVADYIKEHRLYED